MNLWALFGGLALTGILYLYVRFLHAPSGSPWPHTVRRGGMLHGLPAFMGIWVLIAYDTALHSIGIDVSVPLFGAGGFIFLVMTLMMFLTMFGVPMPPTFVPKWIREQDRARREFKRAARAVRKRPKARKRAEKTATRGHDE